MTRDCLLSKAGFSSSAEHEERPAMTDTVRDGEVNGMGAGGLGASVDPE